MARSLDMILIQRISQVPCVIAQNSASALEQGSTNYFLLLLVIRLPPKKVQYPIVDCLSTVDPT